MKKKCMKDSFLMEIIGSLLSCLILILFLLGISNIQEAPVFFAVAVGFGVLLNGILVVLEFMKKNYILSLLFCLIAAAFIVAFVFQIIMIKG